MYESTTTTTTTSSSSSTTPETNNENNNVDNNINTEEDDFGSDNIYQMDAQEMKKKIEELQQKNTALGLSVQRSRHIVRRLKLEYGVLLERLESRIKIDPELNYQNPLPTLETFKNQLLSNPLKKPKNKKQRTRERDPNMPKRPTNAYLLYCEMNKDIIRQRGSFDVTKDLTEGWKSLTEEERAPYYKLYNEEKKRYHQEMEEYYRKLKSSGLAKKPVKENDDEEEREEEEEEEEGGGERMEETEENVEKEEEEVGNATEDVEDIARDKTISTTDNDTSNSESDSPVKEITESITAIQNDFKNIKRQKPDILNPMT